MHDNSKSPQRTPSFDAHDQIIGNGNCFPSDTEDKFSRLYNKRITVLHNNRSHIPDKCLRFFGIEYRKTAMLIELECVPHVQIHRTCMNMQLRSEEHTSELQS